MLLAFAGASAEVQPAASGARAASVDASIVVRLFSRGRRGGAGEGADKKTLEEPSPLGDAYVPLEALRAAGDRGEAVDAWYAVTPVNGCEDATGEVRVVASLGPPPRDALDWGGAEDVSKAQLQLEKAPPKPKPKPEPAQKRRARRSKDAK